MDRRAARGFKGQNIRGYARAITSSSLNLRRRRRIVARRRLRQTGKATARRIFSVALPGEQTDLCSFRARLDRRAEAAPLASRDLAGEIRLYRDLAEREAKIRRLVDSNIMGISKVRFWRPMSLSPWWGTIMGTSLRAACAGRVSRHRSGGIAIRD
jgi:hypothetical protein